jgi:hypothetical protein
MRIALAPILIAAAGWAEAAFGVWQINTAKSTFAGDIRPKQMMVRIEPNPKGEVFTLDRIEGDGRRTSTSAILYLDGEPRRFQDFECSGFELSRRADSRTVEILRMCVSGEWIRLVRRSGPPAELVLEITEQKADGRRFERRLVLEKR